MATVFVNLPTTAANGAGTAVNVSGLAAPKTFANTGNGFFFEPSVTIEISNDLLGVNFVPIHTFQGPGEVTITVAARWARAVVSNFRGGGAPQIDVGADTSTILFTQLVAPAGDGAGASVATGTQALFKSVVVTGAFRGTCNIEISEDGTTWATAMSFQAPGFQSGFFTAQNMRVTRVGVPGVDPGLPLIDIAGDPAMSGSPDTSIAISAGTQSVSTGTVAFSNSNGVSFGMSGSSRVTASFDGIRSISGGTTNALGPGVSFANSNGVTFGVSGSTITASAQTAAPETPFGISAGTQSVSTGTLVFSNSNNVSFGMSGSNTVTASASETPFGLSAGTQSVSTGTLVFSNSNNVSFGMSGSSRITASASETPFGISAGTQSVSTGTVSFANSNGVTFGMSGSNTVTASVAAAVTLSEFVPFLGLSLNGLARPNLTSSASMFVQPRQLPNLTINVVTGGLFTISTNAASTATLSLSTLIGVYTRDVSTLRLLASTQMAYTATVNSNNNDSLYGGIKIATTAWATSFTSGDYWIAQIFASTFSSNQVEARPLGAAPLGTAFSGVPGVAFNTSNQIYPGFGAYSVLTGALPNSFGFSEINGVTATAMAFALGQTVT